MAKNKENYHGRALEWVGVLYVLSLTYAIIRYNVFRQVSWSHLPLYINNKAISLAAAILLSLAYLSGFLARIKWLKAEELPKMRAYFGLYGFGLAAVHSLMSIILLKGSTYYPVLFDHLGRYSLTGELMLTAGVISTMLFSLVAIASIPGMQTALGMERWLKMQQLGYWGLLLTFVHVALIGYPNWVSVNDWPKKMMPITLIADIIIAVTLLSRAARIMTQSKQKSAKIG